MWWTASDDGVVLHVRAVPGARRSEIVGVRGDELRVKVAAPAVEGAANHELRRVVAAWLGVRPAAVRVVRGEHARSKVLHVAGITEPPSISDG